MGSSPLSTILLIALMVVAFYFLLLRPQKKRQQAQQKTQNEIQPGTRVLLGSGIFGDVVSVGEKQAILETSPGIRVTVLKQAIARVVKPGDEYSEPTDLEDDDEDDSFDNPEPVDPPSYDNASTPTYENPSSFENPSTLDNPRSGFENPSLGNEPKKD